GANVAIGLVSIFGVLALMAGISVVVAMLFPEILQQPSQAQEAIRESFPPMALRWLVLLMVFVAVWEEVAFRGFLLTRLHAIVRSWWIAVPLGCIIFGVIHAYQASVAVVVIS